MAFASSKDRTLTGRQPRGSSSLWNLPTGKLAATLLAAVLLVMVGSSVGHFGANQLSRQQALSELDAVSVRVLTRLDDIISEASQVFERLEAEQSPRCSEEQLLGMRTQVFNARFVRDIGRVEDLALHCSSALGNLEIPYQSGPPDLEISHGLGLKTDREVLAGKQTRTMVIEGEQFNALVDPAVVTDLAAAIDSASLFLDAGISTPGSGDWHPFHRDSELTQSGLSSQLCSPETGLCVLLHVPESGVVHWHPQTRAAMAGLGGAAGFAVFLVIFMGLRQEESPERRLRRALEKQQIHAVYQPIVRLPEQRLIGFEALARWSNGDGEPIATEDFITLAEHCGLIGEVSQLMIRTIGQELSPWLRRHPDCVIAINVAPTELDDDSLLDKLERELIGRGVEPQQILIEITERTMVENQAAHARIEQLASRGYRIYADDFGVGYCGLAYLNDMDVHGIKISDLFTAAVATDSPKAVLVPRITELARQLGLDVIVEGVETIQQADSLGELEPVLIQGWLYSKGIGIDELVSRFDGDLGLSPIE